MMRRPWLVGIGALVLLALALLAARVFLADRRLTAMPEQRAEAAARHDEVSFVAVAIRLHYDALAEMLEAQFPTSFEIPESTLTGGASSRTSVQGSGEVERTAPLALSASGESGVRAMTRLRARYTLGSAMLGTESLEAEANVAMSMAFDLDAAWKPVISLQPDIEWIKPPQSRLTRMFNVSLAGLAEQQARAVVGHAEERLPGLIEERFRLQEMIWRAWEGSHTNVRLAEAPAAWLTIEPLGAHFLTPAAQADALVLNTGFTARFSVKPEAGPAPSPPPLPPLAKSPPDVEGVRLAVPVTVAYRTLSDAFARALAGREFTFDAGGTTSTVTIDDVVVYPSAPRIVVGVHVESTLPRRWLDTRGWVYLSATPVFDPASGVLTLADIGFARALDNAWMRLFSAALEARLVQELSRVSRFELGPRLEEATTAANATLHAQLRQALETRMGAGPSRLAERIVVEGGVHGIQSVGFTLADDSLTLLPVVTGSLAVELVPLEQQLSNREGLQ